MDSIPTQVRKVLADLNVDNANEQSILDLSVILARYGHSTFKWAIEIVIRAYRERLQIKSPEWEPNLKGPESNALLEWYLHPFILILLCNADEAKSDEWVRRFRNVEVKDVYEQCMRKAANEFEVRLRGYDLSLDNP